MITMKSRAMAVALAGAALVATPALSATELTNLERASNKPKVSVNIAGESGFPTVVRAFGFRMVESVGGVPVPTADEFLAFCIDLLTNLSSPANYDIGVTSLSGDQQVRVGSFFGANYNQTFVNDVLGGDVVQGAAFQLGLWETVYDDNYDLTSGDFTGSAVGNNAAQNTAINSLASSFVAAANPLNGASLGIVTYFQANPADSTQDLATGGDLSGVVPIPVPAAGVLLLAALGGLGIAGRRKSA